MKSWFLPSVLALLFWGVWAYLPKLTTRYIDPKSAMIFEVLGAMLVALIVLMSMDFKPDLNPKGVGLAVLTGVFGVCGALAYLYAVSKGPVSLVSIATAMYPIITVFLAWGLLKETLGLKQLAGVVLGLFALWLIASE